MKVIAPLALALAAAVVSGTMVPANAQAEAHATAMVSGARARSFTVCKEQEAIPDGSYEVNNNNFGGTRECLTGTQGAPAFRVSVSDATSNSPGSDAFPDIYVGCSWGVCSPHSWLPAKVSALGEARTTFIGSEKAGGTWGAGYDMFFDRHPIRNGQAQTEAMIWLNSRNAYDPAGHGWPEVRIDAALYWVMSWETTNGHQSWRYVQFRKVHPVSREDDMPLAGFFSYLEREGWVTRSWYLLNVEGGFEIWNGGKGLAVTGFWAAPRPASRK